MEEISIHPSDTEKFIFSSVYLRFGDFARRATCGTKTAQIGEDLYSH